MTWLASLLAAILKALFGVALEAKKDNDRMTAREKAAVSDAENQTLEVVNEAADERASIERGGSPDDIARRLQQRAQRRFGNPGRVEGGNTGEA